MWFGMPCLGIGCRTGPKKKFVFRLALIFQQPGAGKMADGFDGRSISEQKRVRLIDTDVERRYVDIKKLVHTWILTGRLLQDN